MIIIAGGRATPRVIEGDLNYAFEPNQGYLSDIWQFNLSKNSMRWAKSRTCGPPEHFMRARRLASPHFPLLSRTSALPLSHNCRLHWSTSAPGLPQVESLEQHILRPVRSLQLD